MPIEVHKWFKTDLVKQRTGTYDMYRLIRCNYEVSAWIMEQDPLEWIYIPIHSRKGPKEPSYWVSEKMILLLILKWPVTHLCER